MPVLTLSGRTATVTVGHGMSSTHWITTVWVDDQLGRPIFYHNFNWTDTPTVSFTVPRGVTHLTPYENCNLHQARPGAARHISRTAAAARGPWSSPAPVAACCSAGLEG